MLALAQALVARGHRVHVLSQPSTQARAEAAGCAFSAFSSLPDYDNRVPLEEQLALVVPMMTGRSVGDDLLTLVADERIDAVVVDPNLSGALAAAESLTIPSAVLLHSLYRTYVDVWFGELWSLLSAPINQTRAAFGVSPADSWPDVFSRHDSILAVVPADFDAPVPDVPSRLRHVGFLVPLSRGSSPLPAGDGPAVLVSMSTTYQRHEAQLQTVIDGLAGLDMRVLVTTGGPVDAAMLRLPSHVVVADYVPHPTVLTDVDVMVTHAGLGSVAAALHFGVPLVCVPINRDQPLNAERVVAVGAGLNLGTSPQPDDVAAAVRMVLDEPSFGVAARAMADASGTSGGATAAAIELESVLE